MRKPMTPIEVAKFWSRVDAQNDFQCWIWFGRKNSAGYGRTTNGLAHRIAYALISGPIPDGQVIRHRCDNPACCNPYHLEVGSHADNSKDCVERGRTATGQRNGRSRLSEDDVAYIRANPDRATLKALAEKFGMAQSSIHYIRNGRSWKAPVRSVEGETTSGKLSA